MTVLLSALELLSLIIALWKILECIQTIIYIFWIVGLTFYILHLSLIKSEFLHITFEILSFSAVWVIHIAVFDWSMNATSWY